jgi:uncharacterized protein (DUF1697 family)
MVSISRRVTDVTVLIRDIIEYKRLMETFPNDWQNDKEQKSDVMFLWDEVDWLNCRVPSFINR